MFRRPARLYRRARRYGKKRLGLSFVQKGSKARYGTSLATTWPFSKRSASSAGMSQNMSEDDWKELGRNAPQSGAGADAPLSKVRFLRPNASVFDYHHVTRRVQQSDFTISGASGTETQYAITGTLLTFVPDYANLVAIYGRYRITRVIYQFIPILTNWPQNGSVAKPIVLSFVNKSSAYTSNIPSSFADCLDDLDAVPHDAESPFVIDYMPMPQRTEDDIETGGSTVVESATEPRWFPTGDDAIKHSGGVVIGKVTSNGGVAGLVSQQFIVYSTVYVDFDSQK